MSVWQRAEPTTVDPDLTEGLSARIADPLWMLARQWQSGEFRGEDAATPIFMRLEGQMVPIDRWQVGPTGAKGPVHTHDPQTPLEPIVEAEHHASGAGGARVGAESAHLLVALLRDVDGLDVAGRNRLVDVLRDAFPLSARHLRGASRPGRGATPRRTRAPAVRRRGVRSHDCVDTRQGPGADRPGSSVRGRGRERHRSDHHVGS